MPVTAPIALVMLENAIHDWVASATGIPGDRVCFVEKRDDGAPDVAMPAALIQCTSSVPVGQREIRKVPSIVQQKITIIASGPGAFGVLVYVGTSLTPTSITYVSGGAEAPDVVAAGLLVELTANLPVGLTAALDPADNTSIIVDGSVAVPLFAIGSADTNKIVITPLRERFPELECEWTRMVWRVTFRSDTMSGFGTSLDLMIRARKDIDRVLRPLLRAAGWEYKGQLLGGVTDPAERDEQQAAFDFALEGYATAAYQRPAMRAFEIDFAV